MSRARITLFGTFNVTTPTGSQVQFTTSHSAQIVALLAIHPDKAVSRDKVAAEIWPDVSIHVARRNFRTALVFAKRSIGSEFIVSDGNTLTFLMTFSSDLQDLDELALVSSLSQSTHEKITVLRAQFEMLSKPAFDGWDAPWIDSFRQQMAERASTAGAELATSYEEAGLHREAIDIASQIISTTPTGLIGEGVLGTLMRSLAHEGRKTDALARYQQYIERLRLEGKPPPSSAILALYKDVESGKSSRGGYLDNTERSIVADLYDTVLKVDPNLALELLAAKAGKWREMAESESTLHLLERTLEATSGWSTARVSIAKDLIAISESLGKFALFTHWANLLISSPEVNLTDRAGALSYSGFCEFERRNYARAEELMTKALQMAKETGDLVTEGVVTSNLAGLYWHQGELERGRAMYKKIFSLVANEDPARQDFIHGILLLNLIYVETMDDQWEQASSYRKQLMEVIESSNSHIILACSQAVIGYVDIKLGRAREGISEIVTGIRLTQQQGRRRFVEISLDYAVAALANFGKVEEATALAIACVHHRSRYSHFHSLAERRVIEVYGGIDMDRLPKDGPLNTLSTARLAAWTSLRLKELARTL